MSSLHFIAESKWYFTFLCLLIPAGICFLLYYRNSRNEDATKPQLIALSVIRYLFLVIISFTLLSLYLRRTSFRTEPAVVLLAADNSASMISGSDSVQLQSAWRELHNSLGSDLQKHVVLFGDDTRETGSAPHFSDKATDMEKLFRDLENNYSNQNIGACVVMTDGIYNKGANPLDAAARLGVPVFVIATGDTVKHRDALIQRVNHNQIAYLNNDFPVEVSIRAHQCKGQQLMLTVRDHTGSVATQKIAIPTDDHFGVVTFTIHAKQPGFARYQIDLQQAGDEKNISNNHSSFVVEVIDNREKILIAYANAHPDISALKESFAGTSYELTVASAADVPKALGGYAMVIAHGGMNQLADECKKANIPCWIIKPEPGDRLPGMRFSGGAGRMNDVEPVTEKSFGLFNVSDGLRNYLSEFPAVKCLFGNYQVSPGAQMLLSQKIGSVETNLPMMFYFEESGYKSSVFTGDGLWKWRMRDYADHGNSQLFDELVNKTVQWLSVKGDKSFFRITPPGIIDENQQVEFGAEVYNQSYEAINDPDVKLIIRNEKGESFNYNFSKQGNHYHLNAGLFPPGEYSFEGTVNADKNVYVKKGHFAIRELMLEKTNTLADHRLLNRLAKETGGQMFFASQTRALADSLVKNVNVKPVTYSETATLSLIDLKWLFWLVLGLMAVEWFFRKRYIGI